MSKCDKCKLAIRGESGIRCDGVCNKVFHNTLKCSGLDEYSSGVLNQSSMIKYVCMDCMQYIQNIDLVVKELQVQVERNSQYLNEYKEEFEMSLKRNEEEIKELLVAIENRYMERVGEMMAGQESIKKGILDLKMIGEVAENFKQESERLCGEIKKSNEIQKVNGNGSKQNIMAGRQMSYAESAKRANDRSREKVLPTMRKELPLVIKPKGKQNSSKTREDLNTKVDPQAFKISNIENSHSGIIVIESEDVDERDKIKNAIEVNMGDEYEIKIPTKIKPRILISNMKFKVAKEDIIEKLKKQNSLIENSELKLISFFERKINNVVKYSAVVEIDADSFPKVIEAGKVNIGWERCKVFDGVDIVRCYKCKGFNHISSECKKEVETCLKCLENHKTSECKNETIIMKCINCIRANNKFEFKFDENHNTFSRLCPVYLNKLEVKKKRIGY